MLLMVVELFSTAVDLPLRIDKLLLLCFIPCYWVDGRSMIVCITELGSISQLGVCVEI